MKIWGNVLSHQNSRPKKPPSPILEIKTWKEHWAPVEGTILSPEVTIVFLLIKQTEGNLPKRSMRWQKEIWFQKWWMFYSEFNFLINHHQFLAPHRSFFWLGHTVIRFLLIYGSRHTFWFLDLKVIQLSQLNGRC